MFQRKTSGGKMRVELIDRVALSLKTNDRTAAGYEMLTNPA